MGNPLHSLGVLLDLFDVEVCKRHLASVSFTRRLYCPGRPYRVFLCRIDDGQQGNLTAVLDGLCTSGPVIADAISLFPGLTDIALVYCHSKQVILCVKKFPDELYYRHTSRCLS